MLEHKSRLPESDIAWLLEALYAHHGYDFRQYSRASISRRICAFMLKLNITDVAHVIAQARQNPSFLNLLVSEVSIPVTEMFRDPLVFKTIREEVLPRLQGVSKPKIWVAGCATGEEVYSLAILLHELGLLEHTQVYATDVNSVALESASKGLVSAKSLQQYAKQYYQSGGQADFCNYYKVKENIGLIEPFLLERVLFTSHNLVHDGVFSEVDVILCRNVLIYFKASLQMQVFDLLSSSLKKDGILCLGNMENLPSDRYRDLFQSLTSDEALYQKCGVQGEQNVA